MSTIDRARSSQSGSWLGACGTETDDGLVLVSALVSTVFEMVDVVGATGVRDDVLASFLSSLSPNKAPVALRVTRTMSVTRVDCRRLPDPRGPLALRFSCCRSVGDSGRGSKLEAWSGLGSSNMGGRGGGGGLAGR